MRQQSTSGSRARQDLSSAKHTIEELFGHIRDIQRKAEQSELMVQEICRDVRRLNKNDPHKYRNSKAKTRSRKSRQRGQKKPKAAQPQQQ